MSEDLGYALVTYRDAAMTRRLIATLNRVFGDPPISIHHDFSKSDLDISDFGANVVQVEQHYRTGWGTLGTVLAMTAAIEHLMSRLDAPRWFYLITGHCYPIQSARKTVSRLDSSNADLFMEQAAFYPPPHDNPRREEWCERYVYPHLRIALPSRRGGWGYRHKTLRRAESKTPFTRDCPCRSGPTYFTGNANAAQALAEGMRDLALLRWYRTRPIVDESLFQTILGNAPGLRICNDDLRFIKWPDPAKEPHETRPKTLTMADAPEISESKAHFARKFLPGRSDDLVAWIDREILR
ncbi:MAG: beta-1,6-N-acetylglucosaminyltransferase [Fimbriimonadales bacterium]